MFTLRDTLLGVLLPAVVAVIVLALAWRPWQGGGVNAKGQWGGPLAIGAGFVGAFWGVLGRPPFPPVDSTDWLFVLAILLAASGLLDARWQLPRWARWSNVLFDASLATGLLLRPLARNSWTLVEAVVWLLALTVVLALIWWTLDTLADRAAGRWLPMPMLFFSACGAITLMLSGSQKLGQLGGALTAALVAFVAVAWWVPRPFARGATPVFVVLYGGLLVSGHFFASLTATNALLLTVAPLGVWASQIPGVRRCSPWQQAVVGTLAAMVPAGTAVTLAAIEFTRSMSEYGY